MQLVERFGMPERLKVGERIKLRRLESNLTLKDVEQKAKVSATHISEIERDLTSPTIGALTRIAEALDVSPAAFLEREHRGSVRVTRHASARSWVDDVWRARLTPLSDNTGRRDISVFQLDLDVGGGVGSAPGYASGEALVHVLAGEVEVDLDTNRHTLRAGDTLHFDATPGHSLRNVGVGSARVIWTTRPQAGL